MLCQRWYVVPDLLLNEWAWGRREQGPRWGSVYEHRRQFQRFFRRHLDVEQCERKVGPMHASVCGRPRGVPSALSGETIRTVPQLRIQCLRPDGGAENTEDNQVCAMRWVQYDVYIEESTSVEANKDNAGSVGRGVAKTFPFFAFVVSDCSQGQGTATGRVVQS